MVRGFVVADKGGPLATNLLAQQNSAPSQYSMKEVVVVHYIMIAMNVGTKKYMRRHSPNNLQIQVSVCTYIIRNKRLTLLHSNFQVR